MLIFKQFYFKSLDVFTLHFICEIKVRTAPKQLYNFEISVKIVYKLFANEEDYTFSMFYFCLCVSS